MYLITYKAYLASLYIAIMGFVLVAANTVIFFCKFTQKDKMLYFHICYFLCILISGIIALTNYDYLDHMTLMQSTGSGAACTNNGYLDECLLSTSFISYRNNFVGFFIVFLIFFILFTLLYHFSVLKILPNEKTKR